MIGCMRTRVRKQPTIALYFESETVLKFYNLEARTHGIQQNNLSNDPPEYQSSEVRIVNECYLITKGVVEQHRQWLPSLI